MNLHKCRLLAAAAAASGCVNDDAALFDNVGVLPTSTAVDPLLLTATLVGRTSSSSTNGIMMLEKQKAARSWRQARDAFASSTVG